jgi:hypothetical protein
MGFAKTPFTFPGDVNDILESYYVRTNEELAASLCDQFKNYVEKYEGRLDKFEMDNIPKVLKAYELLARNEIQIAISQDLDQARNHFKFSAEREKRAAKIKNDIAKKFQNKLKKFQARKDKKLALEKSRQNEDRLHNEEDSSFIKETVFDVQKDLNQTQAKLIKIVEEQQIKLANLASAEAAIGALADAQVNPPKTAGAEILALIKTIEAEKEALLQSFHYNETSDSLQGLKEEVKSDTGTLKGDVKTLLHDTAEMAKEAWHELKEKVSSTSEALASEEGEPSPTPSEPDDSKAKQEVKGSLEDAKENLDEIISEAEERVDETNP